MVGPGVGLGGGGVWLPIRDAAGRTGDADIAGEHADARTYSAPGLPDVRRNDVEYNAKDDQAACRNAAPKGAATGGDRNTPPAGGALRSGPALRKK